MPGKVTNFLWRVCKGFLPTTCELAMKHVEVAANCPWCHGAHKIDTRVLFECDFIKTVWLAIEVHAFDVLRRFFARCSTEQCVMLGMICWSIWNCRNKWVWEKANGSVFGVKSAALNLLHDWREAQAAGVRKRGLLMNEENRKWSKPPDGWFKVNVDATSAHNGDISVGCVVRNAQGEFVGARCKRIEGSWCSKEAEAISLKEALGWTKALNLHLCIFETDSKVLAMACNGRGGDAYFNTIVSYCKQE